VHYSPVHTQISEKTLFLAPAKKMRAALWKAEHFHQPIRSVFAILAAWREKKISRKAPRREGVAQERHMGAHVMGRVKPEWRR
jgi:hypothetical protein